MPAKLRREKIKGKEGIILGRMGVFRREYARKISPNSWGVRKTIEVIFLFKEEGSVKGGDRKGVAALIV